MTLGELIQFLEKEDQSKIVPMGFNNPHSFRGYYDNLAFEPIENVTVGEMLACAKEALGKTYEGYKGGSYTMSENTEVWISNQGTSFHAQNIGYILMNYMCGKY